MSCTITGSGSDYPVGRVVTGAEALSIHLVNDTTNVTTEINLPGYSNYFTVWMTINDGGTYSVFHSVYGSWGFFLRSGTIEDIFEVEIVKNSEQAVEVILRCNDYQFGETVGGYTEATVSLRIRVEDGKQGVFLGWHSEPRISPGPLSLFGDPLNNFHERGERELGTGGGSVVVWSSANTDFVSRHPGWGQRAIWDEVDFPGDNRGAWCGIDDATYGVWDDEESFVTQFDGFPNTQSNAPWYVADLYDNEVAPLCRYIVMRKPIETVASQFSTSQQAALTCHFCNEWVSPYHDDGIFPFQIFIGAFKYIADSSDDYENEPTDELRAEVLTLVRRLEWPGETPREWIRDGVVVPSGTRGLRSKRKRRLY